MAGPNRRTGYATDGTSPTDVLLLVVFTLEDRQVI
jgi:hypothetical protein